MHLTFLIEDSSGKTSLDILVPKLVDTSIHSYEVHPYKGIGRLPKNLGDNGKANKRILLDQLPRLLQGLGRTFNGWGPDFPAAVVLVCDLDNKDLTEFLTELRGLLAQCNPAPLTTFCIAVEEGEAWFLGDMEAILAAYPNAKREVLNQYVNDSICGTWELLADAVHPGGSSDLKAQGFPASGNAKHEWARTITPFMDLENNKSPSFIHFRESISALLS